jgi:hypothetical protein
MQEELLLVINNTSFAFAENLLQQKIRISHEHFAVFTFVVVVMVFVLQRVA